ncbi:hypothetical protein ACHAPA_010289 [Fusarium lateritium]
MMPANQRGPSAFPVFRGGSFPKSICMLTESLIADIPTTEHYVFLYNDVDAPQWERLPLSKRPNWSDGSQNIFAPDNFADGNHHHAVIGTGNPSRSDGTDTPVQVRIGPGGEAIEWYDGPLKLHLDPYHDESKNLRVPFGSAVRIRLRFQLDDSEDHKDTSFMSDDVENVVASGCMPSKDWHDSVRLEIIQGDHTYNISLNMRFVEHQNPDPRVKSMTRVEMFSISGIDLQEQGPRMINGKRVFIYNYLIKLKRCRGRGVPMEVDEEE